MATTTYLGIFYCSPLDPAYVDLWWPIITDALVDIDTAIQTTDATATALAATVAAASAANACVLISTQTASASSTLAFTGLGSTYTAYVVEFSGVYMSTSGTGLGIRMSTNGGSGYDGSSAYRNNYIYTSTDSGTQTTSGGSQDYLYIFGNDSVSDTAAESVSGRFTIRNHASATAKTQIIGESFYSVTGPHWLCNRFAGQNHTAQDTDAIQILPTNGGTITAGTFKLYGIKA